MNCVKTALDKFIMVDWIYPTQIVTTPAKVFDVDLRTCKVEDLEFSSEYKVSVYNNEENL